jgi:hypothetical protein
MKPPARLDSRNVSFAIQGHAVTAELGYDAETRHLVEIAFSEAGKVGQGMHLLLADLGVKLSRAIQGRDAETGEDLI